MTIAFHGREANGGDEQLRLDVGTAHRFVFLGDPASVIRGHFIDCRKQSATRGHRVSLACPDDQLPAVEEHRHAASEKLYAFLDEELRGGSLAQGFPLGELVGRDDVIDAHRSGSDRTPDWEPVEGIHGAGWQRNLVLTSRASAGAGVVVMSEPGVRQIVDHGIHRYEHGAYGIHIALEDRLTFFGEGDRIARATLVDCREGSPTLHAKVEVDFRPSPFRQLIIPPGVAHALQGLDGERALLRREHASELTASAAPA